MYALHYTCSTRNLPETRHALAFHQSSGSSASGKNDQRRLGNWREPTAVNDKCWLLFRFMAALGRILFLILNNRLGRRRSITKGETLYRVGSVEKRPIILGPALLQIDFFPASCRIARGAASRQTPANRSPYAVRARCVITSAPLVVAMSPENPRQISSDKPQCSLMHYLSAAGWDSNCHRPVGTGTLSSACSRWQSRETPLFSVRGHLDCDCCAGHSTGAYNNKATFALNIVYKHRGRIACASGPKKREGRHPSFCATHNPSDSRRPSRFRERQTPRWANCHLSDNQREKPLHARQLTASIGEEEKEIFYLHYGKRNLILVFD